METLTISQVADALGTTVKRVRRLVASGVLPAVRQGGVLKVEQEKLSYYKESEAQSGESAPKPERLKAERAVNWVDISDLWADTPSSDVLFVDLFCGAGGLSKGLEMSGMEGVCGLDWFDEAGLTYRRNFDHPFVNGDIRLKEKKEEFYRTVAERLAGRNLNVVAGGFPCQGFSMAGNRIEDDPRNSLYREMLEIVNTLRPEFVICENVKGLRSMLGGRVEQKIIDDYAAIGYQVNVATLCAADYYPPQKRERVIFIGNRLGVKNYHPKPLISPADYVTTGAAIADLMSHPDDPGFNHVATKHKPEMARRLAQLAEGESLYEGYSDAWKKCPWDQPSCTIKENHGGVNVHPRLPRVLTAREMARLQSFPDDFIFMGNKSKQLVQIGNAVSPLLGKAVGLAVLKSMELYEEIDFSNGHRQDVQWRRRMSPTAPLSI